MAEEQPDNIADPVVQLRDEMNAQFSELKASFEQTLKEKDELIEKLKEQNTGLQRALVRSAVTDPPRQKPVKSDEELYQEKIKALAERTRQYMKQR